MYKVVIADDDKVIQEGLMEEIGWEALGFEVIGTYNDGEELIEFLGSVQVDVVVTDIKMLHVDGIEVARYVYETALPCKVVFISGHKEFEIARQAIRYGVTDYILKPTIDAEVEAVMRKIREELDMRASDMELRRRTESYWSELQPVLAKKLVSSILMGALEDKAELQQRMKLVYPDVEVEYCPCILASMEIVGYDSFIHDWTYGTEQFHDAIENFVSFYRKSGYFHVAYRDMGRIRLFVVMKEYRDTYEENVALCKMQLDQFVESFREVFVPDIVVDIDRIFSNIYEVIDHRSEVVNMTAGWRDQTLYLWEQRKEILTNIMEGNISLAQNIMKSSLNCFTDIRAGRDFMKETLNKISELLKNQNPVQAERMRSFLDAGNLPVMHSVAEMEQYCDRFFDRMKSKEGMKEQFDENYLVNQIKEYVEQHIYEDMCLEDVANNIFISSRHLSRIFKKQTGETFLQYVTSRKMEKAAKLLLEPGRKVSQISEMLGYKTSWHFAKLFYNFYGCNPSEYQHEKLQGERNELRKG